MPASFFQGVFATVLGTSCTAPVLGTAVGFALTQSERDDPADVPRHRRRDERALSAALRATGLGEIAAEAGRVDGARRSS